MLEKIQEKNLVRKRTSKPRYTSTQFEITVSQLQELCNPKSLSAYCRIFGEKEELLYSKLKTSKTEGLTLNDTDIKKNDRFIVYGNNELPERMSKTFMQIALLAFKDRTIILLSFAAIISFVLGLYQTFGKPPEYDEQGLKVPRLDCVEGIAIMIAILVVVIVGAANDYQKERQFSKLNKKKESREIVVIRNGFERMISIHDILVGDLLILQTGDVIPADCILVDGTCECDESGLTGESDTVKKHSLEVALRQYKDLASIDPNIDIDFKDAYGNKVYDPIMISGSKIFSGLGKAIVVNVGVNSINGRTMMSLKAEPEPTMLQERLSKLTDTISIYGSVVGFILFLVLLLRFLTYLPAGGKFCDLNFAQKCSKFMDIFIIAVTIIIVAVPEGLPLAVTLALAFATTRMTKDGNLVRVLRACETMGSATVICCDKTGTLTQNKMSVVTGIFGDSKFSDIISARRPYEQSDKVVKFKLSESVKKNILTNITLNSTAFENKDVQKKANDCLFQKPKKHFIPWFKLKKDTTKNLDNLSHSEQTNNLFIGSNTETALLTMVFNSFNMRNLQLIRSDPSKLGVEKIIQVIPFESFRKMSGIVVKQMDGTFRLYVKGAAEIILKKCQYKMKSDGTKVLLTTELYQEAVKILEDMAGESLRTISLAHKDFNNLPSWPPQHLKNHEEPLALDSLFGENIWSSDGDRPYASNNEDVGLVLDGIVGIQDLLREGVKESVEQCKKSGVTVKMVTGDNIPTAKAIARNCGILSEVEYNDPRCAMEGSSFRRLTEFQRQNIIPNLRVLARSSPEDKRILVESLKKMGELVAVTGDGTNDAPALTLADVGFSMGISGTEVAREASDIILMSDNFNAIVSAIKWGRCVGISIKKFIQFQLTVNITAVILTMISSITSSEQISALKAVQLLWVNLIMDTFAALALATDRPDKNILERKPSGRNAPLISVSTWKMIIGQSILQLTITLILNFAGNRIFFPGRNMITSYEHQQLNTLIFNTFVWLQFFKLIVSRKLDEADGITDWRARITASNINFFQDLTRNPCFVLIMAIIGIFQVLIMFFGGAAFSIVRQSVVMWVAALMFGFLSLPVGALIRICPDEWAIAIFPARLIAIIKYILGLEFLRYHKKYKEESLFFDDKQSKILLMGVPAFERAKSEVLFHKEHIGGNKKFLFNFMNIIRRWRSPDYDSPYSDDDYSLIASLTMVPTLVGGAIGGFSQMSPAIFADNGSGSISVDFIGYNKKKD